MPVLTRCAPKPYKGCKVYGPYYHRKQSRFYVCIEWNRRKRLSTAYARYLMAIHLKRRLKDGEEVDHKNNVKTDDRIDNLQVLNGTKHRQKRKPKEGEPICMNCGGALEKYIQFYMGGLVFCSEVCCAKYPFID